MLKNLQDTSKKLLIIGPHPDDIEFSTGRLILKRNAKNTTVICMTDGRKGQDGTEINKILPEDQYAKIRIKETKIALTQLGIQNPIFLNLPDQEIIKNPYVIDRLYLIIEEINPDYVLIPPYEGAHPDHDGAHLFTVIALTNIKFPVQNIIEYGSYNYFNGVFTIQEFIPSSTKPEYLIPTPNEQKTWLNVMKSFKSQKNQQEHYIPKSKHEIFRIKPNYDYTKLPYETETANIIRSLLPQKISKHILSKKDKMFYETWECNINPNDIKAKLHNHMQNYKDE